MSISVSYKINHSMILLILCLSWAQTCPQPHKQQCIHTLCPPHQPGFQHFVTRFKTSTPVWRLNPSPFLFVPFAIAFPHLSTAAAPQGPQLCPWAALQQQQQEPQPWFLQELQNCLREAIKKQSNRATFH